MYHFAIVALLGLALWKTVGMILGFIKRDLDAPIRALVTLALGIVVAEWADYSVYAGWGVTFSESYLDTGLTGLTIGAMAYVWHNVLGFVEGVGRLNRDQARELEHRPPRAA